MIHGVVRAVILAAGASIRMGRPKAALPLGDRADTFLSRLVRTCAAAQIPDIVVVSGAHDDAVRAAVRPWDGRARVVHNPDWQRGQLSSLLAGLAHGSSALLEALLVTLVDVPLTSTETVTRVLQTWRTTRAPIVRPARGEVHGHPVIFDAVLFDELRHADPAVGAKAVVRGHAQEIINVPVTDEGAFIDIDTQGDYASIVPRLR